MEIAASSTNSDIDRLQRRLERERTARREAEAIAESATSALYRKQQLIELMLEISVASNEADMIEDAFRTAVDRICRFADWPVGHVYILSEKRPAVLTSAGIWNSGQSDVFDNFRVHTRDTDLPKGVGLPGNVVLTGIPQWEFDFADAKYPRSRIAGTSGLKAAFAFPVVTGTEVVAILEFFTTQAVEPDHSLLEVMAGIGKQLGRVVERQRSTAHIRTLNELLGDRLRWMSILHEIDESITAAPNLATTLGMIEAVAVEELGVHAARIFQYDDDGNFVAHRNCSETGMQIVEIEPPGAASELRVAAARAGDVLSLDRVTQADHMELLPATVSKDDVFTYYGTPLTVQDEMIGFLEIWRHADRPPHPEWMNLLETLTKQAAISIDHHRLLAGLKRSNEEMRLAYDATIEGWSSFLDLRDKETEGHSQRVTAMTLRMAEALDLPAPDIVTMRRGALLHDIGKMGVPDQILLKPAKLTEEEWLIMKCHPVWAYEMLSPIDFLRPALDIPYYHHEKWDGSGYPRGLRGEEIPLAARIFAIVNVWDALSSDRPYRKAWSVEKVREHVSSLAGTHFDPKLVEVFLAMDAPELRASHRHPDARTAA